MAILRSLGAGPKRLSMLLVFESTLVTLIGVSIGVVLELTSFFILESWLQNQFGLYLVGSPFTSTEAVYLTVTLVFGMLVGLIPAYKASQLALKDGLSVRV